MDSSDSYRHGDFFGEDPVEYEQATALIKHLILQSNCHTARQYQVSIPYNYLTRKLDLGHTLYHIFQQIIPKGHSYQVFYYCPESQYFVFGGMYPFQNYLFLGPQFISQAVISVKIIRINPPITLETEAMYKKKRVNERTIKEVLQKVAEWRNLNQKKNITLQEAAKIMDLPKKTLDDYFYQIRQGQEYGFDFQLNINQKIGVLRKFVKENHTKKSEKPLKIIQTFMQHLPGKQVQQEQNESQNSQQQ